MEEAGEVGVWGGIEEQRKPLTNSPEALARLPECCVQENLGGQQHGAARVGP